MKYLDVFIDIFFTDERYMYIVKGLGFSLSVTFLSSVIGVIVGVLLALMGISNFYPFKFIHKLRNFNPLRTFSKIYIDIIRGTPVVVQLMIFANIIFVGNLRNTPILIVATLAFGLNSGAYVAEIIRSGIESLDKGQMEASRALGLNYFYSFKEVILPQAIKNILPSLVNEFIVLLKETSIVGFIGGVDLLRASNIITSQTYRGVEPLLTVGFIYFILTYVFSIFMRKIERRLKASD